MTTTVPSPSAAAADIITGDASVLVAVVVNQDNCSDNDNDD